MVKRILTRRMLPILLLFLALLPVFSKFVTGGSSFSWEMFLIVIIDGVFIDSSCDSDFLYFLELVSKVERII